LIDGRRPRRRRGAGQAESQEKSTCRYPYLHQEFLIFHAPLPFFLYAPSKRAALFLCSPRVSGYPALPSSTALDRQRKLRFNEEKNIETVPA
jgi:hypothetical protein